MQCQQARHAYEKEHFILNKYDTTTKFHLALQFWLIGVTATRILHISYRFLTAVATIEVPDGDNAEAAASFTAIEEWGTEEATQEISKV